MYPRSRTTMHYSYPHVPGRPLQPAEIPGIPLRTTLSSNGAIRMANDISSLLLSPHPGPGGGRGSVSYANAIFELRLSYVTRVTVLSPSRYSRSLRESSSFVFLGFGFSIIRQRARSTWKRLISPRRPPAPNVVPDSDSQVTRGP